MPVKSPSAARKQTILSLRNASSFRHAGVAGTTSAWSPDDLGGGRPALDALGAPEERIDPVVEAQRLRDKELSDAYALGFEEGRREGEEGEQARLQHALRAAEDALNVFRTNEERWQGSIEENIAALATIIARHVIDREIASDESIVLKLVRRALGEFPVDQAVRIRVNPNDLALIEAHGGLEQADLGPRRESHWIADHRISTGGCVVEGRDRIIDGRVDTALERAYRRLAYTATNA